VDKRLAFGVWRLAFGVWRLAFGVWRLAFGEIFPRQIYSLSTGIYNFPNMVPKKAGYPPSNFLTEIK
jgi:hypothetical protein